MHGRRVCGIQERSAFGIGSAGFALRTGCIAGWAFTAGLVAALAFTWAFSFRAAFAVAGTFCFGAAFAITRALSLRTTLAVAGTFCFRAAITVAGTFPFRTAVAITRTIHRRSEASRTVALTRHRDWGPPAVQGRRHQFVEGQLAIVVPVELSERLGGVVEFLLVDLAVAISVEDGDHRRGDRSAVARWRAGRALSWIRRSAFAALTWRAFEQPPGFTWRIVGCLCGREARRKGECECDEDCVGFHGDVVCVVCRVCV